MSETTYEAANIEAALAKAAESMGASPDDLQYEVVEEKTDFWGGDEGTVVLKVWRADEVAEPEAEVEQEPETQVDAAAPEGVDEPEAAAEDPEPAATGGSFWDGDEGAEVEEESEEENEEESEEENEEEAEEEVEEPPSEAHEEIVEVLTLAMAGGGF